MHPTCVVCSLSFARAGTNGTIDADWKQLCVHLSYYWHAGCSVWDVWISFSCHGAWRLPLLAAIKDGDALACGGCKMLGLPA